MAAFDSEANYAADVQYLDGVKAGQLIVRGLDRRPIGSEVAGKCLVGVLGSKGFAAALLDLGFAPTDVAVSWWKANESDADPEAGHEIRVGDDRWNILAVNEHKCGNVFICVCAAAGEADEVDKL